MSDDNVNKINNVLAFKKKDDDSELASMATFLRDMAEKLENREVKSMALTYFMNDNSCGGDWYGDMRDIIYVNQLTTISNIVDELYN